MYRMIDWENLDWSKLDEHDKEKYARWYREGRKEVMWNWIKCLAVALPVLFIVACSVNIATEPDPYPESCMKVQSWETGDWCNVLYD
jgi:hypothetical protein